MIEAQQDAITKHRELMDLLGAQLENEATNSLKLVSFLSHNNLVFFLTTLVLRFL